MGNVLMQLLQLALHRDDTPGLVSTTLKFLHPYYSLTSKLHSVLPTGKKKMTHATTQNDSDDNGAKMLYQFCIFKGYSMATLAFG